MCDGVLSAVPVKAHSHSHGVAAAVRGPSCRWACPRCTVVNSGSAVCCTVCAAPRYDDTVETAAGVKGLLREVAQAYQALDRRGTKARDSRMRVVLTKFPTTLYTQPDSWSCGYRNVQMMGSAAAAVPALRERLWGGAAVDGSVPSVLSLQAMIEEGWRQGLEPSSKRELWPVVGSTKWIGSSECFVVFAQAMPECCHSACGRVGLQF